MKAFWMAVPWAVGGCAAAADNAGRLTPFREALFREGALRDVAVDGRRYCVADLGQGPPILLLHGLGGSIYDWRHLLRPLSTDHRVIAVDLLGAGESEIPEREDFSLPAQARRIRGLFDHLGVERATLVGNSYGGGIALRFAQDWPDRVDRLVLINSICYPDHIPSYVHLAQAPCAEWVAELLPLGSMTRWVLKKSYRTVERLSDEELDAYVRELRAPGRRSSVIRMIRQVMPADVTEFEARIRSIQAPALLIWGTSDRTVPASLGLRLSRELPRARLVELAAGHVPNQECPGEVLRLMSDFLE
jgi:pimeloyl-ACP methyl ester carboxylesterase